MAQTEQFFEQFFSYSYLGHAGMPPQRCRKESEPVELQHLTRAGRSRLEWLGPRALQDFRAAVVRAGGGRQQLQYRGCRWLARYLENGHCVASWLPRGQVVANLCLLFAVLSATPASKQAFVLICVSSCMQGVSDGITRGPTIALMDDSCPAGRRGDLYTIQNVIYLAAASWGPVLGALVFVEEGDRWDLDNMKWVIVIGIIIGLPAPIPLCLMDDRRALGRQSEAVYLQQEFTTAATSQNREARELATRSARTACCGLITVKRVRLLLFAGDVLLCVAIGMTVKFFPVFFHVECKQSPVTVQFIFASMSLLAAVGSLVTNKIAKRVGRLQVVIPW